MRLQSILDSSHVRVPGVTNQIQYELYNLEKNASRQLSSLQTTMFAVLGCFFYVPDGSFEVIIVSYCLVRYPDM